MTLATIVSPLETPTRRPWSVTAGRQYGLCPRQWSYNHGPHQMRLIDTRRHIPKARGIVLHAALRAAYKAADTEGRERPIDVPKGASMARYWFEAKKAANAAWVYSGLPMPDDDDPKAGPLAHQILDVLRQLLESLPIPAPHSIAEVEKRHMLVSSSGLPFVVGPDLVLHVGDDGLIIRDWKYGDVTKRTGAEVRRDYQLNLYAVGLSAIYPRVRRFFLELYSISRRDRVYVEADSGCAVATLDWLESTAERAEADAECAPRPGDHCGDCPFRSLCPAHK